MQAGETTVSGKKRVGVFHPGTQHSWQTARALQDSGMLGWYASSIFYVPERWPYRIERWLPEKLSRKAHAEFMRFYHPALDPRFVHTFGVDHWAMRVAARLGYPDLAKNISRRDERTFGRATRKMMQRDPVDAVWGYDLCSLETFAEAEKRGVKRILDRTIGHPRAFNRIISEVHAQYGEYFITDNFLVKENIVERADEEHAKADLILVGSEFCKSTMADCAVPGAREKTKVVNYCFDDNFFMRPQEPRRRKPGEPLKFLFLGQAGPRKGIHLALKVFDRIPKSAATLTIVGKLQVPKDVFARHADRVVTHNVVPRAQVAGFMAAADCLIFPSYFEGSAISLYEAAAMGLPSICSRNTGFDSGADFGLTMSELTEDELYRCVMSVIEHPEQLDAWLENTPSTVASATFAAYSERVREVVQNV